MRNKDARTWDWADFRRVLRKWGASFALWLLLHCSVRICGFPMVYVLRKKSLLKILLIVSWLFVFTFFYCVTVPGVVWTVKDGSPGGVPCILTACSLVLLSSGWHCASRQVPEWRLRCHFRNFLRAELFGSHFPIFFTSKGLEKPSSHLT